MDLAGIMGRFTRMIAAAFVASGLLSVLEGIVVLGFGSGASTRLGGGPVVTIWTYVLGGIVLVSFGIATPFVLPRALRFIATRYGTSRKPP
ncbi:MAG TPA: hypothetical protein VJ300_06870 [Thermoplasmata archaeon]|nr:hypothetical protein [Thermoplasmata archaeon]